MGCPETDQRVNKEKGVRMLFDITSINKNERNQAIGLIDYILNINTFKKCYIVFSVSPLHILTCVSIVILIYSNYNTNHACMLIMILKVTAQY